MKQTKKQINLWIIALVLVMGIGLTIFMRHNAFLYKYTVAQVTATQTLSKHKNEDTHQNVDYSTTQNITLKILNGQHKNKKFNLHNTYTYSQALDQKYHPGQQVLVTLNAKSPSKSVIIGQKRDTLIVTLIWLTILLILVIVRKKGALSILSLLVNVLLFILAIQLELRHNGKHLLPIFAVLVVLFTLFTIGLIFGLNAEMFVSSVATITATSVSFLLFLLVLKLTHEQGIHYEAVSYAVQQPKTIFLAQVMIGVLGAIMDESTDITSAMHQLKYENPGLPFHKVFRSGLNMGKQIIGPLISILFLIFMADTIPMAILYLRNGNSIVETFNWTMYLGLVQSLVSAIGIVLTVPLTSALAGRFIGGKR
ncbi:YibE/F family protein [Lactobacillus sp. CC-MHH1034]|uniref:YibE/F family protein n=1 Tax=Agrilactobacillus fermenti TaxID=2586909 RepID=UPI001E39C68B|nr:YibE/F family protein [Agrilactobacillus fermenti]MCD2256296.1 YibE/F family protein [Agrilactobacillus fermenti]